MNMEDMSLEELAEVQEKHRRQMEDNRNKVQERKARTHRLIVIGSTLAKYMPELTAMSDDDIRISVSNVAKTAKPD